MELLPPPPERKRLLPLVLLQHCWCLEMFEASKTCSLPPCTVLLCPSTAPAPQPPEGTVPPACPWSPGACFRAPNCQRSAHLGSCSHELSGYHQNLLC